MPPFFSPYNAALHHFIKETQMNFNHMYTQWSAAFRDLAAAQFGLFMDGWKTMEKSVHELPNFWKK